MRYPNRTTSFGTTALGICAVMLSIFGDSHLALAQKSEGLAAAMPESQRIFISAVVAKACEKSKIESCEVIFSNSYENNSKSINKSSIGGGLTIRPSVLFQSNISDAVPIFETPLALYIVERTARNRRLKIAVPPWFKISPNAPGDIQETHLQDKDIEVYDDFSKILDDIRAGNVDGLIGNELGLLSVADHALILGIQQPMRKRATWFGNSLVLAPGAETKTEFPKIQDAIREMLASSDYIELNQKHFPVMVHSRANCASNTTWKSFISPLYDAKQLQQLWNEK